MWISLYTISYVNNTLQYHYISQSNTGSENRICIHPWQAITLFQGITGFQYAYENLSDTSSHFVVEIGVFLCTHHKMKPSELMYKVPRHGGVEIMEEIERIIDFNRKSARK